MTSLPNGPDNAKDSASVPVPSTNTFPYTFKAVRDPALQAPGGKGKLPGASLPDPRILQAEVAARYQASVNEANAKSAAQRQADTRGVQPQHTTPKATFHAAPRRKGK